MMSQSVSNLKQDERIVFVTTDARLTADRQFWVIPIHAWVHELDPAGIRTALIAAAFRLRYGLHITAGSRENFERRARLITADNERGKRLVIRLAGTDIELPATAPNGHVRHTVRLSSDIVDTCADDGLLHYEAVLPGGDPRQFPGSVRLIPDSGVSVISDFDDTVKITHATDRPRLLDHTFYRDFESVPGMAQLYTAWAECGAALHFVSSSPWHLYEPIEEFLQQAGFPRHTTCLRHFRFKDASLLNLVRPGTATKPQQIHPILNAFPQRTFIFVGDSGQHDPEVYGDVARRFPKQTRHICIRNITGANRTDERFRQVFRDVPSEKWTLFDDPHALLPLHSR